MKIPGDFLGAEIQVRIPTNELTPEVQALLLNAGTGPRRFVDLSVTLATAGPVRWDYDGPVDTYARFTLRATMRSQIQLVRSEEVNEP